MKPIQLLLLVLLITCYNFSSFAQVNLGPGSGTTGGLTNTFIGESTGAANTVDGTYNTALGYRSLMTNTSGKFGVGLGAFALYNNTTGENNVGTGYQTLYSNTTGSVNLAYGVKALYTNTAGNHNIAIGSHALYTNTASNNLAIGSSAMHLNTTGNSNVAIGYQTLKDYTTGSNNVAIGFNSSIAGNFSHNTTVGYLSSTTGSWSTAIGGNSTAGQYSVAVGRSAAAPSQGTIAIGHAAEAQYGVAMGYQSKVLHIGGMVLGHNMVTTAGYQLLIGNVTPGYGIRDVYIGGGVAQSLATNYGPLTIQPSGNSGTDVPGLPIRIAGGKATGTGTPADISFMSSTPTTSGTDLQALATKMIIKGNTGNVGIATTTPTARLDVVMTAIAEPALKLKSVASQTTGTFELQNSAGTSVVTMRPTDGTTSGQSVLAINGDNKNNNPAISVTNIGNGISGISFSKSSGGSLDLRDFDGSPTWRYTNKHAKFHVDNDDNDATSTESFTFSHDNQPATVSLMLLKGQASQTGDMIRVKDGVSADIFKVTAAGGGYYAAGVSIGTTNLPSGYKLAVGGNIIAEKVLVKLQANWPDFVFEKGYRLPTLREIEAFINQHKHLPGVPSAADVEKNGIDLGDNQAILLKKIEELTLHMIEMDKKLERLSDENEALKKKLGVPVSL